MQPESAFIFFWWSAPQHPSSTFLSEKNTIWTHPKSTYGSVYTMWQDAHLNPKTHSGPEVLNPNGFSQRLDTLLLKLWLNPVFFLSYSPYIICYLYKWGIKEMPTAPLNLTVSCRHHAHVGGRHDLLLTRPHLGKSGVIKNTSSSVAINSDIVLT